MACLGGDLEAGLASFLAGAASLALEADRIFLSGETLVWARVGLAEVFLASEVVGTLFFAGAAVELLACCFFGSGEALRLKRSERVLTSAALGVFATDLDLDLAEGAAVGFCTFSSFS